MNRELKETRNSNIELLRIFVMLGVIILHFNDGKGLEYVTDSLNKYTLYFMESVSICAVNVFVIISGYYMSRNNNVKYNKLFDLLFRVIYYNFVFYILGCFFGNQTSFSLKELLYRLIPNNYYVILYVTLCVISPYLNIIVNNFINNNKGYYLFLIIWVVLFSVYPIGVDLLCEVTGQEWMGLSSIGAYGSQNGFTIVNFITLYFVGAGIRFFEEQSEYSKRQIIIIFLFALILDFLWAIANDFMHVSSLRTAWCYHNILVIVLAASLVCFFLKINFESRIINELAKSTFTCYLVHYVFLSYIDIEKIVSLPVYLMTFLILLIAICIYIVCYFVYKVQHVFLNKVVKIDNRGK